MMRREIAKISTNTDKLWFPVYHPLFKDDSGNPIPQGWVNLSFELLPK